jgi:hypothetical protein
VWPLRQDFIFLTGASQLGIIEHSQLPGYPRLQAFQQHYLLGQRRIWHRITEDLADHHRDLPGLLAARWAHLLGGGSDCGIGRPPQRALLLTAEDQLGQLLTASVGKLPDQPPSESVSDEHHTSSLPATAQLPEISPSSRRGTATVMRGCAAVDRYGALTARADLTTAGPRQTGDSQANSDLRQITRNAFFIGTIEILGLAGQKYNLNGGFWSLI